MIICLKKMRTNDVFYEVLELNSENIGNRILTYF
jgi:hypothetical protein